MSEFVIYLWRNRIQKNDMILFNERDLEKISIIFSFFFGFPSLFGKSSGQGRVEGLGDQIIFWFCLTVAVFWVVIHFV